MRLQVINNVEAVALLRLLHGYPDRGQWRWGTKLSMVSGSQNLHSLISLIRRLQYVSNVSQVIS
jgi:hypothetical protein